MKIKTATIYPVKGKIIICKREDIDMTDFTVTIYDLDEKIVIPMSNILKIRIDK